MEPLHIVEAAKLLFSLESPHSPTKSKTHNQSSDAKKEKYDSWDFDDDFDEGKQKENKDDDENDAPLGSWDEIPSEKQSKQNPTQSLFQSPLFGSSLYFDHSMQGTSITQKKPANRSPVDTITNTVSSVLHNHGDTQNALTDGKNTPFKGESLWSAANDLSAIVIASRHRILFWLPMDATIKSVNEIDSEVTAVMYLRVHSPRLSSQNFAIAGYQSGHIRVFDFDGNLLLCQLLHNQPVVRIKIRGSGNYPESLALDTTEDVTILHHQRTAVTIDGANLVAAIESCCIQLSHSITRPSMVSKSPLGGFTTELSFKKWLFDTQIQVYDVACIGLGNDSPLLTLPLSKQKVANTYRFFGVGCRPVLSFYAASEDQSSWSKAGAIASAMATKLTSAVMNVAFSFWSKPKQEQPQQSAAETAPVIEAPVTIGCQSSLNDTPRVVRSVETDVTCRYALTVDNFGRIMLVDLVYFSVAHMWKGYRDAQFAFFHLPSGHGNRATDDNGSAESIEKIVSPCVALYAPRLNLLEVWRIPRPQRITFWRIPERGRLLSSTPGLGYKAAQVFQQRAFFIQSDGSVMDMTTETANALVK